MRLVLSRHALLPKYTIGKLYIDGVFFCNTLEDTDRGLYANMTLKDIKAKKVYGETAIPYGEYEIDMDTVSPKYSKKTTYADVTNGGYMPRLKNVKGWDGVLIHGGNRPEDSLGCVLVGNNTVVGQLTNSFATFKALYARMYEAHRNGETITLVIERR